MLQLKKEHNFYFLIKVLKIPIDTDIQIKCRHPGSGNVYRKLKIFQEDSGGGEREKGIGGRALDGDKAEKSQKPNGDRTLDRRLVPNTVRPVSTPKLHTPRIWTGVTLTESGISLRSESPGLTYLRSPLQACVDCRGTRDRRRDASWGKVGNKIIRS